MTYTGTNDSFDKDEARDKYRYCQTSGNSLNFLALNEHLIDALPSLLSKVNERTRRNTQTHTSVHTLDVLKRSNGLRALLDLWLTGEKQMSFQGHS